MINKLQSIYPVSEEASRSDKEDWCRGDDRCIGRNRIDFTGRLGMGGDRIPGDLAGEEMGGDREFRERRGNGGHFGGVMET